MLYDCAGKIESDTVLFQDAFTTNLTVPSVTFRRIAESDSMFPHKVEPEGEWMIEVGREVAATGGILFHYNVPYGDIYMEVAEPFRRRGYGSYLVQELKRTCYEMGKVPAARCNASNTASRATLQKAGLLPCARLLTGTLTP
jgi:GNAT superfamily N-acetyltransferase